MNTTGYSFLTREETPDMSVSNQHGTARQYHYKMSTHLQKYCIHTYIHTKPKCPTESDDALKHGHMGLSWNVYTLHTLVSRCTKLQ